MRSELKQRIFLKIPTDLHSVYRICKNYVDRHEGELNADMDTNGEMWLAKQVCATAKRVFDVGANRGQWSSRVLDINPSLELHAFEPSASTFEELRRAAPDAIANQIGLSNVPGEATLHSFGDGHSLNSLYMRKGLQTDDEQLQQRHSETVRLGTIDDYCKTKGIDRIDFVKIDAEGHDLEVLRGAADMLDAKNIRLIQFEYSGCNLDSGLFLAHFFDLLEGKGYSLAKLLPDAIRPTAKYHRGLETFRYQNWIAYPRGAAPRVKTRA